MESPAIRSRTMRAVKSKDTTPELLVRRLVHGAGYRYRLHRKDLPGCPDLAFGGRRKVIFVNGCFWHGHDCSRGARVPEHNRDYWIAKIARNRARDDVAQASLQAMGWSALVLWECELKDASSLARRLKRFLG
jgi:DNA mismatch endonuclease, patch repair protein